MRDPVARHLAPPETWTATLEAVVEAQIAACREILDATQRIERAVADLDFGALDRALADRARAMARITELEAEAEELRGRDFAPPRNIEPRLSELAQVVEAVRTADQRAREAADRAMEGLRERLKDLSHTQRGLRGYRPHGPLPPRFTDRRG